MSADAKRPKSPTAAITDIATTASTPGIVINRSATGSSRVSTARSRSTTASSSPWKSSCRSSASTLRRSSAGSGCRVSHARPAVPNRSLAGHGGARLRASTAWTWFFRRVRCRTRCARRDTMRRSILVRSSASHTGGRKSAASSWARMRASTLSVLTLASAIARVFLGFDTTTRATNGDSSTAIASLLPVASNATSSSGRNVAAQARNASGVTPMRPSSRHNPSSTTAICANSRCTSIPIALPMRMLLIGRCGEEPPGRTATTTDSRSQRSRASRRGGHVLTRARSPESRTACPR